MGRWTGIIDKIDDVLGRRKRGFVDGEVAQYPPGMDPDVYIQNPIPPMSVLPPGIINKLEGGPSTAAPYPRDMYSTPEQLYKGAHARDDADVDPETLRRWMKAREEKGLL